MGLQEEKEDGVITRRQLMQDAVVAGAAAALPLQTAAQAAGGRWFDQPMRWAQLTLVENDPGQFDPRFWLDFFRRTHSDAATLSAGGVVAYYPTRIPLHHRSAWMKDTDPFGELLAGCRKLGMRVLARTDPHAVHQDVYDAHPDWIAVDSGGGKQRHWASPELWLTCALGPYNFEFMTEVHREIMTLYRVDGIFSNRWAPQVMCYCEHCRRDFREASGLDLPLKEDRRDPLWRRYDLWRRGRLNQLVLLWDGVVRGINPEARFVPNGYPDLKAAGEMADILFIDRQGRSGLAAPWLNGRHAKRYRAVLGRKPIGGIFSVGLEEAYRWKDSVQSEAEIRIWVADGAANGMRPWFTKFSGTLYDRRWLNTVEQIYAWHYRAERYLRNEEPLARVGLVYSEQTEKYYDAGPRRDGTTGPELGMYHALIESRLPFEMVHDTRLDPAQVDRFRLLILPNIAALSSAQCQALRDYVRRGGNLLATFETSLCDEWGARRNDFGLADLFGVSFAGRLEGPMRNSYLALHADPRTGAWHPVLKGLEDAGRIINGVWRVDVKPAGAFPSPLTLIPSYPDLPMEMVFPREAQSGVRGIYLREIGPGRVVYFPWDIDRVFWEILNADHGRLLANAIDWAANEERPVTVAGPGVLDVTVWRQRESITVHLVNLTNPMMMKGPFRELVPVGPQAVSVRLPEGRKARKVQLLVAATAPQAEERNGRLALTVPAVLDHEVIAIDL
jgi:hypothetical protein